MERRAFIKSTAAALSVPFWLQGCEYLASDTFQVYLHSDHLAGHLLMKSREWTRSDSGAIQTIIVGGGLAGVSAACGIQNRDFRLFELSSRLGGTSAAQLHQGLRFSQGAHYELAYPDSYGKEALSFFERLAIIKYEPWKKTWSFTDQQHIIPFARRQQCYENGKIRKEVIEEGILKEHFYDLMKPYAGQMHLPTRLIDEKHRHLNEINLLDFLIENRLDSPDFKRQIDYHMLDDWGGTSDQVSALAGIHYFMCRPYLTQSVDLFSPPEGNHYFLDKMMESIPVENMYSNHLVSRIEKNGENFVVEVLDVVNERVQVHRAERVIYAGQKHALKYIYPKESSLFDQVQAPWMVVNFVCEGDPKKYGFWQNEFLGENEAFLGFIDSSVQDRKTQGGKRIITGYYCLKPEDRDYLTTIPEYKERIAKETLGYIREMLNEDLRVDACFINVMGHAMSIPTKGFLFNDANDQGTDLVYAGVDNGRLPLLFEAVDSGLMAAEISQS